jgi:hypothetical protein
MGLGGYFSTPRHVPYIVHVLLSILLLVKRKVAQLNMWMLHHRKEWPQWIALSETLIGTNLVTGEVYHPGSVALWKNFENGDPDGVTCIYFDSMHPNHTITN